MRPCLVYESKESTVRMTLGERRVPPYFQRRAQARAGRRSAENSLRLTQRVSKTVPEKTEA